MKHLLTILFSVIIFFASAQKKISPVVSGSRTIEMSFGNDHEELNFPVISDRYPKLQAALCDTCLLLGSSVDSVKKQFETDGSGITNLDYEITFQNSKCISFIFTGQTMGAYPDDYQTYVTYDIATGNVYNLGHELTPAGLQCVFNAYRNAFIKELRYWQNPRIARDADERENREYVIDELRNYIKSLTPASLFKNYVFTKKGIQFNSGYLLAHAFRPLDPGTDWLIPYSKLMPYLKRGSFITTQIKKGYK